MKKLERNSPAEEKALKAAMAADPDTWEATEAEFASARRGRPPVPEPKTAVSIRFDKDVLETLRASGKGWQTRVNALLRKELNLG